MIGSLLPEWIGLALTPLAIVGTVVLLSTARPLANSFSFCLSFGLVYSILSVATILIGRASGVSPEDSDAHHVVSLVVGLAFLFIAIVLALRPARSRREPPGWSKALTSATPGKIFVTGAAASLINPNVAILLSGLTFLVTLGIPTQEQFAWAATLVLASLVPFLIPIGIYVVLGEHSRHVLGTMMDWLIAHDRAITIGMLLLFGVMFAGRGIAGLL